MFERCLTDGSNQIATCSKTHLVPYEKSLIEFFHENSLRLKTVKYFAKKSSIIDVWQDPKYTLLEKCPHSEFLFLFLPFSDLIRRDTEYLSLFSPNRGNTDQITSEYGHFSRSDTFNANEKQMKEMLII